VLSQITDPRQIESSKTKQKTAGNSKEKTAGNSKEIKCLTSQIKLECKKQSCRNKSEQGKSPTRKDWLSTVQSSCTTFK